jgi:hypothetical protein
MRPTFPVCISTDYHANIVIISMHLFPKVHNFKQKIKPIQKQLYNTVTICNCFLIRALFIISNPNLIILTFLSPLACHLGLLTVIIQNTNKSDLPNVTGHCIIAECKIRTSCGAHQPSCFYFMINCSIWFAVCVMNYFILLICSQDTLSTFTRVHITLHMARKQVIKYLFCRLLLLTPWTNILLSSE